MSVRCYLVRHAQTVWNSENRLQGHSDQPLSLFGRQQARRVGALFASCHLNGIYTSHLTRSRQTAEAIAAGNGHGVAPVTEQELAEMHLGAWEGLTPEEIDAKFHGAYQQWRTQPSSVAIPEAESPVIFRQRVRRIFQRLMSQFDEGEYVVVSHGGVIAAVLADLWGAEYDALLRRLRLDNAGVTALELGAHPHVLWVNATTHLEVPPAASPWF